MMIRKVWEKVKVCSTFQFTTRYILQSFVTTRTALYNCRLLVLKYYNNIGIAIFVTFKTTTKYFDLCRSNNIYFPKKRGISKRFTTVINQSTAVFIYSRKL